MQKLLTEDGPGVTTGTRGFLGQRRKWLMLPQPVLYPQGQGNGNQQWANPPRWTVCVMPPRRKGGKWGWFRVMFHFSFTHSHVLSDEMVA